MAKRRERDQREDLEEEGAEDRGCSLQSQLRALVDKLELEPWLDRAGEMLKARPGVTIGVAVGTGFVLGLTLFSKIGRIALIGALGAGAELLLRRARVSMMERASAR